MDSKSTQILRRLVKSALGLILFLTSALAAVFPSVFLWDYFLNGLSKRVAAMAMLVTVIILILVAVKALHWIWRGEIWRAALCGLVFSLFYMLLIVADRIVLGVVK